MSPRPHLNLTSWHFKEIDPSKFWFILHETYHCMCTGVKTLRVIFVAKTNFSLRGTNFYTLSLRSFHHEGSCRSKLQWNPDFSIFPRFFEPLGDNSVEPKVASLPSFEHYTFTLDLLNFPIFQKSFPSAQLNTVSFPRFFKPIFVFLRGSKNRDSTVFVNSTKFINNHSAL